MCCTGHRDINRKFDIGEVTKAEEEEAKRRVRESNEFQEYLKLKRQYENHEN